jgi:hypothetical protein
MPYLSWVIDAQQNRKAGADPAVILLIYQTELLKRSSLLMFI